MLKYSQAHTTQVRPQALIAESATLAIMQVAKWTGSLQYSSTSIVLGVPEFQGPDRDFQNFWVLDVATDGYNTR